MLTREQVLMHITCNMFGAKVGKLIGDEKFYNKFMECMNRTFNKYTNMYIFNAVTLDMVGDSVSR